MNRAQRALRAGVERGDDVIWRCYVFGMKGVASMLASCVATAATAVAMTFLPVFFAIWMDQLFAVMTPLQGLRFI